VAQTLHSPRLMKLRLTLFLALFGSSLVAGDDPKSNDSPDAAMGTPDAAQGTPDAAHGTPDAAASPDASATGFSLDGITSGDAVPATGQIVVAWAVFTGSPDVTYIYGKGTQAGPTFHAAMTDVPPAAALNNGTGVGLVLLFAADATLPPEGVYTGNDAPPGLIGGAVLHSIVYRAPGAGATPLPWATSFPIGYSCGVCVEAQTGFDSFAPTDCGQVDVKAPMDLSTLHGCNFF